MINFRFHVVSIVAVFLALAIGVVFGSTIVDQAIVDQLRADFKNTKDKVEETRDQNEQLKTDLERWERYVESNSSYAVEGRLKGGHVVMLIERGVAGDLVETTEDLLVAAGVADSARVWLEPAFLDSEKLGRLAEIVGSSSLDPVVVRAAAYDAIAAGVAAELEGAPDTETTTSTGESATPERDVLDALADEGFVEIADELDSILATSVRDRRVMVISRSDSEFADAEELAAIAASLDAVGLDTAVGEEFREPAEGVAEPVDRGARLATITTGELGDRIATVDNLDEAQGPISIIIALADLRSGVVGHYGFGTGATRSAPEWSPA